MFLQDDILKFVYLRHPKVEQSCSKQQPIQLKD